MPGPGKYDPSNLQSEKEVASIFKSKTKRKAEEDIVNAPSPAAYNLHHYDIATRVIKEEEDDPDLIIRKPGFGIGEQRFK